MMSSCTYFNVSTALADNGGRGGGGGGEEEEGVGVFGDVEGVGAAVARRELQISSSRRRSESGRSTSMCL